MSIELTRPVTAPQQEALDKPTRGSAQRAAVITLILAIICQPVLHPTGPGNSSPVDLLLIASIVAAYGAFAAGHRVSMPTSTGSTGGGGTDSGAGSSSEG